MKKILLCLFITVLFFTVSSCSKYEIDPPSLTNNPQLDMILTNERPIFSVSNPKNIKGDYTITYEISMDPDFPKDKTISYKGVPQLNENVSQKQVEEGDELKDGTYYWRAKTVLKNEKSSEWVKTRFYLNTKDSQTFSGFMRAPVKDIKVSSGEDPKNIIDWNDQGQITFWNNSPRSKDEAFSWVMFDMGRKTPVTRFWMLSTRNTILAAGWLKHFVWQGSDDGKNWKNIPGTEIVKNDTYRNIIDFKPTNNRYYRLVIYSQNSLQAQLNVVIPYVKGKPGVPSVPNGDYVLLIGNQMDGFTYTELAKFVEDHGFKTITIPHYEMSLEVLKKLKNKPMAIIFSGNNADWQYLPLFEYYGEWEIYRNVYNIPMMGICAGNEFYGMAYGVSFAHWMGWFDDTMFRITKGETPAKVKILPAFLDDPIFEDLPNPFRAVEIHSWSISPLFLKDPRYSEFVLTGKTTYVQTIKSTKRPVYSEQFHGAVVNDYNQSGTYLANFLKIAKEYKEKNY